MTRWMVAAVALCVLLSSSTLARAGLSDTVGLPLEFRHVSHGAVVASSGEHLSEFHYAGVTVADGITATVTAADDGSGGVVWEVEVGNGAALESYADLRWNGQSWLGDFVVPGREASDFIRIGTPGFWAPGERNVGDGARDALLAMIFGMLMWGMIYWSWGKRSVHL